MVHHLRRRWKPIKERLGHDEKHQPVLIRFHRACSWLARVDQAAPDDHDERLIFGWIAFNAWYGQWDDAIGGPLSEKRAWPLFCKKVVALDKVGRIGDMLDEHRQLVLKIVDDQWISKQVWEEPDRSVNPGWRNFHVRDALREKRWEAILQQTLTRIYFVRCQLVHGGATWNGSVNRTAVRRTSIMLGHILPTLIETIIDHGAEQDWGDICYPPR